jgi:hypothetical protein
MQAGRPYGESPEESGSSGIPVRPVKTAGSSGEIGPSLDAVPVLEIGLRMVATVIEQDMEQIYRLGKVSFGWGRQAPLRNHL